MAERDVVPQLKALIYCCLDSDGQGCGFAFRVCHALLKPANLQHQMANVPFNLLLSVALNRYMYFFYSHGLNIYILAGKFKGRIVL